MDPLVLEAGENTDKVLERFDKNSYTILVPRGVEVGPFCRTSIEIVQFRDKVEKGNRSGRPIYKFLDWFPTDGSIALNAIGVSKIALAAEMKFLSTQIQKSEDEYGRLLSVVCQIPVLYRKPTGEIVTASGSKRWSYGEAIDTQEASKGLSVDWLAKQRQYALERTETGAKFRAVLSVLGMDHSFLTETEAMKPIVVAHTQKFVPDSSLDSDAIRAYLYPDGQNNLTGDGPTGSTEVKHLPENTTKETAPSAATGRDTSPSTGDPALKAKISELEKLLENPALDEDYRKNIRTQINTIRQFPESGDKIGAVETYIRQTNRRIG